MEAGGDVFADVVVIFLSLVVCCMGVLGMGWIIVGVWCACLVTQMVDDCRFLCWVYVSRFPDLMDLFMVSDILVFVSSSTLYET